MIMTFHGISRNKSKSIRRLGYDLDSQGIGVRVSAKAEIIGRFYCQQNFTNVNVNLSYHSMTTCFDRITVILRTSVGTKVYECQNCVS